MEGVLTGSRGAAGPGHDDGFGGRRGRRDWAVDIALFLGAVGYGLVWAVLLSEDPEVSETALVREQAVCAAACAAVWLRRRWPVGLSLGLIPLSAYAALADGAQLVALFTVAVHRSARTAALCATATVVGQLVYFGLFAFFVVPEHRPDDGELQWIVAFTTVTVVAVLGWGAVIRHRRQLVLSLRERAVRAESEARLRAEQAQMHARERIAREMHDVLGHRLSLLSVHAGALEYRPDAPSGEVARAAAVIRDSAHRALQDLREVIGVLRAPVGELPQPTLADVRGLVTESVAAGMRVRLDEEVAGREPETIGRTAYRIVQEGLTNVRRHSPGARVGVRLHGGPGDGLTVEVRNTAPAADAGAEAWPVASDGSADRGPRPGSASAGGDVRGVSGADSGPMVHEGSSGPEPAPVHSEHHVGGQGLIGLAERASLVGGTISHGPDGSEGFLLRAWLPWPSAE